MGGGSPYLRKSRISRLTSQPLDPCPSPRARSPGRASSVPAPRRFGYSGCGASFHPLESVPDGRAATPAPVTDSRSQNGGGGGRERGHAKGPPRRGERAGPSRGRAEAVPRRAHSRTHALPLHPRPLPARGAARRRRRGTVQPVGDARQLHGRPQPLPPRSQRGPGTLAPTAPERQRPGMAPAQAAR